MELINWKLDKITDVWNHYFWEYKTLQKKINFNSEAKTNYYGEILGYFTDTFDLIRLNEENKFQSNVFHYTGLLQIIYVQQDLTDELLYIFKLNESLRSDKNPNRNIRNELVGHPISRSLNKEFESSVLFSNEMSNVKLQYLKYSKVNNFKMEVVTHSTQNIINEHKAYLNKYFDKILSKICFILDGYKLRLGQFEKSLSQNIKFETIIKQTESTFEYLLRFNYLYKKEYLIECYNRQSEHPRYKFVVEIFLKELTSLLKESQKNITNFIDEIKEGPKEQEFIPEETIFVDFKEVRTINPKRKLSRISTMP